MTYEEKKAFKHVCVYILCLKCSVLAPVSLRPLLLNAESALIGQLIQA